MVLQKSHQINNKGKRLVFSLSTSIPKPNTPFTQQNERYIHLHGSCSCPINEAPRVQGAVIQLPGTLTNVETREPDKDLGRSSFIISATVECQLVEPTANICIHLPSVLLAPPAENYQLVVYAYVFAHLSHHEP